MKKVGELNGKLIMAGRPNELRKGQYLYSEVDGKIVLSQIDDSGTIVPVTGNPLEAASKEEEPIEVLEVENTNTDSNADIDSIKEELEKGSISQEEINNIIKTVLED